MDDIFVSGTKQQPRGRDDNADGENYKKKVSKGRKMMENRKKIDASRDKALNQSKSRFAVKKRKKNQE